MREIDIKHAITIGDAFTEKFNNGDIDIKDLQMKGSLDLQYPDGSNATIQFYKDDDEKFRYRILDQEFHQIYPDNESILKNLANRVREMCSKETYNFNISEEEERKNIIRIHGDYVVACMEKGYFDVEHIPFIQILLSKDKQINIRFFKDSSGKIRYEEIPVIKVEKDE